MRVATLLPAATEMAFALGVEPVGVSHECDYPPAAADLQSLTRSRVSGDGTSSEVNREVAEAVGQGGVFEIDRPALAATDPDLVVTQGTCDVCAVDDDHVRTVLDALDLNAAVLGVHPHSLEDVFTEVQRLGDALGLGAEARDLVSEYRTRVESVRDRAARTDRAPSVAVLDWLDPVMVAGHWVPEMVELAGGTYPLADPGEASRPRQWAAVREADPDVLVAAPCGFELEQTRSTVTDLTDRGGWDHLSAVQSGRAYAVDGHHHVNRPGPRLVDTLEALAGLLHPDEFDEPPGAVAEPLAAPSLD